MGAGPDILERPNNVWNLVLQVVSFKYLTQARSIGFVGSKEPVTTAINCS